jgi:flavodoxin
MTSKNTLICWFSRSGNTRRLVDIVSNKTGAATYQIRTASDYSGVTGLARSVFHCAFRSPVPLLDPVPDLTPYKYIIVATPVWGWKVPKPVVSFLNAVDLRGKYVLPLATCAGSGKGFFRDFEKFIGRGTLMETSTFAAVGSETTASLEQKIDHWLSLL